jgi:hypothetical protein
VDDAKDTINRTLSEVKTFLAQEAPPRLSEADTKAHFIEPLVRALGWEGIGVVTREYYVRNSQEFIDYYRAAEMARWFSRAVACPGRSSGRAWPWCGCSRR